jgi:hypothetical protein
LHLDEVIGVVDVDDEVEQAHLLHPPTMLLLLPRFMPRLGEHEIEGRRRHVLEGGTHRHVLPRELLWLSFDRRAIWVAVSSSGGTHSSSSCLTRRMRLHGGED